ncbi:MAG: hypothetical protein QNK23_11390 [Crocinitomicaceae bacterium]|nr:hypothetical protein [Crocinitomicaceae bacterium]
MKSRILSFSLFVLISATSIGQSREFIRNKIETWGECKNVALTLTGGDAALYGRNGWAGRDLPATFTNTLDELNDDNELIDDIQITEEGRWLILYGNNGLKWHNLSSSLESKLREFNNNNEVITSVTFNDDGDWIAITTDHIASSDSEINEWITDGLDDYGALWAAHVTEDAIVACYARGYKFFGNVPDGLKEKLRETDMDVYRIKFLSDGAFFIADKEGNYAYFL